jgi:hypothetical protein
MFIVLNKYLLKTVKYIYYVDNNKFVSLLYI